MTRPKTLSIPQTVAERAVARYTLTESGCWISEYPKRVNGYAAISYSDPAVGRNRSYYAHRAAYTFAHGPIPDGLQIDHKCFTRSCVNPDHLRALTPDENARRQGIDFPLGQCRWGHPLSAQRPFGIKTPVRMCGACQDERNAAQSQMKQSLVQLEIAYGLGGHEKKRNYAFMVRKRQARVDLIRAEQACPSVRPEEA